MRRAKPTIVKYNGEDIMFDSILESREAKKLMHLEKAGLISDLIFHPKFVLQESFKVFTTKSKNGKGTQQTISYTPDMKYVDNRSGENVCIEVKGYATADYRLRRRMFLYQLEEHKVDVFIEIGAKYREEIRLQNIKGL